MKLIKFINFYKTQYQINQVYGFDDNLADYLINNKFAIEVKEVEAPKEPLIELETETNTINQVEVKHVVKRKTKGK
jgi:hypothetical protein